MKESEIVLSIVIPAYNAENTIVKALDSIKKHKNSLMVEIIIVNDGSTDNTKKICTDYIRKNKTQNVIFKLVNQKNAGHGSVINYGISNARGRYLKVLDADDYLRQDNYDDYLKFLSRCKSDLVCSDYEETSGKERKRFYWHSDKKTFNNRKYKDVINNTTPYLLPCVAVKLETIRQAQIPIDEKCCYDDQEYDFLIIQFCKTVSYFASSVYCYMVGSTSQSMSQKNLIKNIKDHQRVTEWVIRRYYSVDLPQKKKAFIFNKMLIPLCHYQYYICVQFKKSRRDFLSFDNFLKDYKELYLHHRVAGKRLKLHRFFRGVFI